MGDKADEITVGSSADWKLPGLTPATQSVWDAPKKVDLGSPKTSADVPLPRDAGDDQPLLYLQLRKDLTNNKIGLGISPHDNAALCVKRIDPGLIQSYNDTTGLAPARQVHVGDLIIEVNGFKGNPQTILEVISKDSVLDLVIQKYPSLSEMDEACGLSQGT